MNQMGINSRLQRLEARQAAGGYKPILILTQGRGMGDYSPEYCHDDKGNIYTLADVDKMSDEYQLIIVRHVR